MGCSSCSTTKGGQPGGCKNNGTCGTDGCNKLTVFDWLSNMALPAGQEVFEGVEVRFKNSRKHFYRNTSNLSLSIGDIVATEASPGHDIGIVSLTGELVKVQMKKKKVSINSEDILKIYRKATQKDIDIWVACRDKEEAIKKRARELAISLDLQMKISDVEFQADGSKATFYYTAEERVDFRQLIKDMAKAFSIRIEMRQIGFRQEAARLGGIGSCGRELCCSTWLTDFRSVNTVSARYQQLSLNPQKLAGQCGKLKCCLNFELDTYLDALQDFPKTDTKLFTKKGRASCQKIDIFKGLLWFAYDDNFANWHKLTVVQVKEILTLNAKRESVEALEDWSTELEQETVTNFENVVGQDSLTRFDKPKRRKSRQASRSKRAKSPKRTKTPVSTAVNDRKDTLKKPVSKRSGTAGIQKQKSSLERTDSKRSKKHTTRKPKDSRDPGTREKPMDKHKPRPAGSRSRPKRSKPNPNANLDDAKQ